MRRGAHAKTQPGIGRRVRRGGHFRFCGGNAVEKHDGALRSDPRWRLNTEGEIDFAIFDRNQLSHSVTPFHEEIREHAKANRSIAGQKICADLIDLDLGRLIGRTANVSAPLSHGIIDGMRI